MRRAATATLALLAALLVPAPAHAEPEPVPPHPSSPLAGLPDPVLRGQVVALADGDRYEVTSTAGGRSIRGRRWDAATRSWGPAQVIFHDDDLRCWGVVARGSGNGVAVRIGCGPALVEEWDGHPHAIVSADTQTWQSRRLPGYGWASTGISPDGTQAVWARGDDYYTWSAATGFVRRVADPPRPVFEGEAPMITDAGTVTIAYEDDSCSVTFDTYLSAGVPTRQVLPTGPDCYSTGVTAIDSRTLAFGDDADEWSNARLTRSGDDSPWVVSAVAPLSAPGLLSDRFLRGFAPLLLDAPDLPLAVVGNGPADLRVQVFDPAAQAWRSPVSMLTRSSGTRCNYRNDLTAGLGFYALSLRCTGADRLVSSPDGAAWTAWPLRAQAVGPNATLGLVAVPDHHRTVVLGRGSATAVPVGTDGGCDVVVPVAADRLLRLTSSRGRDGWPDLLQRSTPSGWRTVHRVEVPRHGSCGRVFPGLRAGPRFSLQGRRGSMRVQFVEQDGRWDVRVHAR
ncbi:hypothetical protein [Nocardioides currus]|uniref:Ricin B lectin domain-containing protein n=1 Tax=Nocardioides currus TaxID=2133958 RepID=A0A2R7YVD6_9ACTN|nr:hypothetical protein [Nocardioides currus]PUA80370.1 hypothetical protein C7S10_14695 [Nocardioides currus]